MSEQDLDEIVYVDDDGLGFTRRDFPAADYPPGTRVALYGVSKLGQISGTVVTASQATEHLSPSASPTEYVPVFWDLSRRVTWVAVGGLKLI
jgi:hypothetical protein